MKIAFTGSFDPPHLGHKFVVDTCKDLGLEVFVFIASNPDKSYKYSVKERVDLSSKMFLCPVVESQSPFVAQDIISNGIDIIVRGLRDTKDFEYEQEITDFNYKNFGIKTVYIPCDESLRDMSSTNEKRKLI